MFAAVTAAVDPAELTTPENRETCVKVVEDNWSALVLRSRMWGFWGERLDL
jgi:hypothetical protein